MKTEEELIWESFLSEGKNRDRKILNRLKQHQPLKPADILQYIKDKPHLSLERIKKGYIFTNRNTGGKASIHTHNEGLEFDRGSVKHIYQVIKGLPVTK